MLRKAIMDVKAKPQVRHMNREITHEGEMNERKK